MTKENMKKKGRKTVELLKQTFRKLYKKMINKIEISERATYNISVELKPHNNCMQDAESLTVSKPNERNASGNLFLNLLINVKCQ